MLQFHVKVILPTSKDNDVLQVKRFETDMPLYVHTFGDLAEFAAFRHMSLKTAYAPITVESIYVDEGYMQTSNASINGVFGASNSLKLRSANGPITAVVDLLNQGSEPTILDIETSNSPINCAVSLAASDNGPGAGGTFDVRTITSNSPLKLSFKSSPTGAKLQTIARTSNSRATIAMHPEFEGSFQAETSRFGQTDLEMLNLADPIGKGRKRIFQDVRKEKGSARGSVFWQRETVDDYDVRRRGGVEVKTSNGPISTPNNQEAKRERMSYINAYRPPSDTIPEKELYGPSPYDLNFVVPVPDVLSTGKVKLVPFVPRKHAARFMSRVEGHADFFKYMPLNLETLHDWLFFVEKIMRRDEGNILFAVFDTSGLRPELVEQDKDLGVPGGALAGAIGLAYTDPHNLTSEIGPVIVLPQFRRTHVSSHEVGAILRWGLERSSVSDDPTEGGLELRRIAWQAGPENAASNGLAKKMGFKFEGIGKWAWVIPTPKPGFKKIGKRAREGDSRMGRDTMRWAVCWDDWEDGGRKLLDELLSK
ncbi:hypothetical protein CONPUDRAFT_165172 [Coniophora puteana RWD-64-598 SS2]|uniref:N-acetyltransferase domain-containing protein n=1 Tax=Coniophora puteana (strain RWD-64-598) TaxID=741705 RepID=A0A5M3MQX8_CONPW|nr:uncharacterized protein CONPUDRAFT_165172 [Coniophora puteana RWD-64-598 SS2]EIW80931.1 hypothetical protein CONPUDRAFT_165172 [Coniophora puteana RWD-64-598 SS2]